MMTQNVIMYSQKLTLLNAIASIAPNRYRFKNYASIISIVSTRVNALSSVSLNHMAILLLGLLVYSYGFTSGHHLIADRS